MYLALFLLMRFVLRRESSAISVTDLLVVVLLAEAAQNAIASDYTSIPDGVLLVVTILGWSWVLNWLAFRIPLVQRLVHPPPLELVHDGQLVRHNMRKELISREELMTELRQQGVEDVAQVKTACMEGNGQISVVTFENGDKAQSSKKQQRII
jgi:uncharacterized membrane protein YcaP (DUF421 family)